MYSTVKTKSNEKCKSTSEWDQAIADAHELLDRVERRAERIRGAIRTFKECRDAGEPYNAKQVADGVN